MTDLSLVFAAGVFATFNPCGFAMLPAYMTMLLTSQRDSESLPKLVVKALQFAVLMALGIISVFALFAVAIFPISTSIQAYLPIATITIGALLIAVGIATLSGKSPYLKKLWSPNTAPSERLKSLYLYGVTFALGSVSCTIGPLLAATSKALELTFVESLRIYLIYALGISVTIAVLALIALFSQATLGRIRKSMKLIERISSLFLILVGFYLIVFGLYETKFSNWVEPLHALIDQVFSLQSHVVDFVNSILTTLGVL
ncbi:CcdA Cytochrome c biogenesis protein [Candidatus Nanopelagicaceae bacterium]